MSESITFDVSYKTSFHEIEKLREKMLEFIKAERRDFEPVFDVTVKGRHFSRSIEPLFLIQFCFILVDISDQSKMTLSTDIKYRSNIQHGALSGALFYVCAIIHSFDLMSYSETA